MKQALCAFMIALSACGTLKPGEPKVNHTASEHVYATAVTAKDYFEYGINYQLDKIPYHVDPHHELCQHSNGAVITQDENREHSKYILLCEEWGPNPSLAKLELVVHENMHIAGTLKQIDYEQFRLDFEQWYVDLATGDKEHPLKKCTSRLFVESDTLSIAYGSHLTRNFVGREGDEMFSVAGTCIALLPPTFTVPNTLLNYYNGIVKKDILDKKRAQ